MAKVNMDKLIKKIDESDLFLIEVKKNYFLKLKSPEFVDSIRILKDLFKPIHKVDADLDIHFAKSYGEGKAKICVYLMDDYEHSELMAYLTMLKLNFGKDECIKFRIETDPYIIEQCYVPPIRNPLFIPTRYL